MDISKLGNRGTTETNESEVVPNNTSGDKNIQAIFDAIPDNLIPEKAKGINATVAYDITGGGGGQWSITIEDGSIQVSEGVISEPTVSVEVSADDYFDIAVGKLSGITAFTSGKIKIQGDMQFMSRFSQMFRPFRTAG